MNGTVSIHLMTAYATTHHPAPQGPGSWFRQRTLAGAAILAMILRGETVHPIVDVLHERIGPTVFTPGHVPWALPETSASIPRCQKPMHLHPRACDLFDSSRRLLQRPQRSERLWPLLA
jgi:hypothetical protein